jgi:hypothetical protein
MHYKYRLRRLEVRSAFQRRPQTECFVYRPLQATGYKYTILSPCPSHSYHNKTYPVYSRNYSSCCWTNTLTSNLHWSASYLVKLHLTIERKYVCTCPWSKMHQDTGYLVPLFWDEHVKSPLILFWHLTNFEPLNGWKQTISYALWEELNIHHYNKTEINLSVELQNAL